MYLTFYNIVKIALFQYIHNNVN